MPKVVKCVRLLHAKRRSHQHTSSTMNDDLRTLSTKVLRQQLSDAVAAAKVGGGADSPSLSPSSIDPTAVHEFLEALQERDKPSLRCESAHALLDEADAIQNVAVAALMEQLKSNDKPTSAKAGAVLREIINGDSEVRRSLVLGPMVKGIMGDDREIQRKFTGDIRSILWIRPDPPIQKLVETGIVPKMVSFLLQDDDAALQLDAARVLAVIAEETHANAKVLVDAGAIPAFVRCLRSTIATVKVLSASALANIAQNDSQNRNMMLQSGAVQPLLALTSQDSSLDVRRAAIWALRNLCIGVPRDAFELILPALPALAEFISDPDEEIVANACGSLCGLTANGYIQEVVDAGVCRRLVEQLLRHPSDNVQYAAVVAVGDIFTGSNRQIQMIFRHDPLPSILGLLASTHEYVQLGACRSIANLVAKGQDQIQVVIDCNIVPSLIQLLASPVFGVQAEAARAIGYFTSKGTTNQVQALVGAGCIPPLCSALTVDASQSKVVSSSLTGLRNILYVGWKLEEPGDIVDRSGPKTNPMALLISSSTAGGLSKLLDMRRHPDEEIRTRAFDILERYFGIGENFEFPATAAGTDEEGIGS